MLRVSFPAALLLSIALVSTAAAQDAAPQAPTPPPPAATDAPAWKADLQRRREALIVRNGSGTDKALQDQLLAMQETDQQARGVMHGAPADKTRTTTALNLNDVDTQNTAQLKEIVTRDGWPTIALVGIDASNAAMLLLTHTRDTAWRASLLDQLEQLADTGKIDGSALAGVIDKQLVAQGQLQRYGTQFKYVDGAMSMLGVEDPAGLDARRAQVFLPPMAVYRQQLEAMYHLKATDKVVMATPPAK